MQPDDLKRYRVIIQGIFRQPTAGDSDGSGFYTARCVAAHSPQHAEELALRLVKEDPRCLHAGVRARLRIDEVVALEAGDEAEEGPLGFIFYGNNPADNW